jgi:putative inorganic carbon (HCO3(-)) transporter
MSFRRPRAFLEGKLPSLAGTESQRAVAVAAPPVSFGGPAVAAPPANISPVSQASVEGSQPVVRIGSVLMSWFLFIYFSRLLDVASPITLPLHIPMFLMMGLLVLALAAGGLQRLLASRIGVFEVMFVVWVGVASAFSSWRSGSLQTYRDCLYAAMVFFAILALVRNLKQLARVARAMAFAGLAAAIFGFIFSQVSRGRVAVDIGTLADPNEYALILLMTLPYWWLVARNSKSPRLMGAISLLAAVPILVAFFRAGSRAGLVTLVGLIVAVFIRVRPAQKVILAITVTVVLVVAWVTLPGFLRERYLTWFSSDADQGTQESLSADIESSRARRYYLFQSLKLTLEHPLLGLGPGQFAGINWEVSKAAGMHIGAQPTHNTYTEVSSETGIPGLILFIGTLVVCFRSTLRIAKLSANKASLKPISNIATCILVSLTAFVIGAFFLSLSYSALLTAALGLGAALQNIAVEEFGMPVARPGQRQA